MTDEAITEDNVENVLARESERRGLNLICPESLDLRLRFKPDFKSEYESPDKVPCSLGSTEFPFNEVCQRLDGPNSEPTSPVAEISNEQAWTALRQMLQWLFAHKAPDQRAIKSIGIKAIAAGWILRPEMFNDSPAVNVAKEFGISPQMLSSRAAEFSRLFKVQNCHQKHDGRNSRQIVIAP